MPPQTLMSKTKRLIQLHGITQTMLSRESGVSQTRVHEIITGNKTPKIETAYALWQACQRILERYAPSTKAKTDN